MEARDAAKHPTLHRAVPVMKSYLALYQVARHQAERRSLYSCHCPGYAMKTSVWFSVVLYKTHGTLLWVWDIRGIHVCIWYIYILAPFSFKRWQVFDTLTYFSISTASGLGQDTEHGSKSFFMLKVFHHNIQFTSNEQYYTIRGLNKVFDHSLKYFLSTNCMEHYFGSWLGQKQQIFNNSGIKIPRIKSNTKMILTI